MKQQQFYEVIMQVQVTRRVLASSPEEAEEKVDLGDMRHEMQHYGPDEEIIVEAVEDLTPSEYDVIEDIGEQIVKHRNDPMHMLKKQYAKIQHINKQLAEAGKHTMEPFAFNTLTDDFLKRLRS